MSINSDPGFEDKKLFYQIVVPSLKGNIFNE